MKKNLLSITILLFSISVIMAGRKYQIQSNIGPAYATTTVSLSAGGTGAYNCLEYLVVRSTTNFNVLVLNGNTTFYQVSSSSSTEHQAPFSNDTPLCGSANTSMDIKMTGIGNATPDISYSGFVGK